MSLTLALLIGYFAFLLAGFVLGTRPLTHPWLFLLRGFFPKWQFFHSLGLTPRVYFRLQHNEDWSNWHKFMPRAKRQFSHLIFNPQVNLALSEQNLVELLASDLAACSSETEVPQLVSYKMIDRLVREKAQLVSPYSAYQFQICLERAGEPVNIEAQALLISPILLLETWAN